MNGLIGIYSSLMSIVINIFINDKNIKKNCYIINSTNNKNYNHNSKYFFEYLIKNEKKKIKFVINDKRLKKKLEEKYGSYFITNFKLRDIIYILKSKTWIVSTLELPIIEPFKQKRRKIIHLGHGIPLKKIGIAERNISLLKILNRKIRIKNIDYFLSPSEKCDKSILECFGKRSQIFNCGQPRNDILSNNQSKLKKKYNLESDQKIILYAPTWRPYSDTIFFPFENLDIKKLKLFLEEKNIILFLRPHPFFKHKIRPDILSLSRIKYLNNEILPEIMEVLSEIDLLITDYSSIFFDYLIMDRPILFLPYDREKYENEVGFTMDYMELIKGNIAETYENFEDKISDFLKGNFNHSKGLKNIKNTLSELKEKNSSQRLFEILNNLN